MKKYLLFCFDQCFPAGGFEDFTGCFSTIDECYKNRKGDYYQIIDYKTLKIIDCGQINLNINDELNQIKKEINIAREILKYKKENI